MPSTSMTGTPMRTCALSDSTKCPSSRTTTVVASPTLASMRNTHHDAVAPRARPPLLMDCFILCIMFGWTALLSSQSNTPRSLFLLAQPFVMAASFCTFSWRAGREGLHLRDICRTFHGERTACVDGGRAAGGGGARGAGAGGSALRQNKSLPLPPPILQAAHQHALRNGTVLNQWCYKKTS